MKKEFIDFASEKLKLMSLAGSIVLGLGTVCAAAVAIVMLRTNQTVKDLSGNCEKFKHSNQGSNISTEGTNCGNLINQRREQATLPVLYIPTGLDLEKLFAAGDYNLNDKQKDELTKRDKLFRSLAQQRQILYIQGSADETGSNHFFNNLSTDRCGNQIDFNQIQLHLSLKGSYEPQLSSRTIPSLFTNIDLPQLRARSLQCFLRNKYPNILTEIIEGGVKTGNASQYRRVRIFTDNKSITSQSVSKPSPD
jgi:hypothetical protein